MGSDVDEIDGWMCSRGDRLLVRASGLTRREGESWRALTEMVDASLTDTDFSDAAHHLCQRASTQGANLL